MNYTMTNPCNRCPFLKKYAKSYGIRRLEEFAMGTFPCHKTASEVDDGEGMSEFIANKDSQFCAGLLIYLEKRKRTNQMTRIAERLGMYDPTKLNMKAAVL